jgi:hypothetical protein
MKIESQYVSYEIAKLLKQKGFNELTRTYYTLDNTEKEWILIGSNSKSFWNHQNDEVYSAPEIWQVVEWLDQKYSIYIYVNVFQTDTQHYYTAWIQRLNEEDIIAKYNLTKKAPYHSPFAFRSSKEAFIEAILYTLTNFTNENH